MGTAELTAEIAEWRERERRLRGLLLKAQGRAARLERLARQYRRLALLLEAEAFAAEGNAEGVVVDLCYERGGALVAAQHNERVRYCTRVTDSLRNRAATAY